MTCDDSMIQWYDSINDNLLKWFYISISDCVLPIMKVKKNISKNLITLEKLYFLSSVRTSIQITLIHMYNILIWI